MATDIIARGMAAEAEKTANKYKAGANIVFTENADGTVAIEASGEVSSEDTVARNLINNHKEDTGNPHGVTAEQIGLGNVDNTSDLEKPISNAMQDVLDKKVDSNNLGTAAYKDVPIDGDASDSQVVLGNDSRLSDSRKADGGNAATLETHPASDFVLSSDFEAHAGNAEIHVTTAEKEAFVRNFGYWRDAKSIKDYISEVNVSGFCLISTLVTDMPVDGAAWLCVINCSNGSKQITAYKISSNKPCAYSMAYFAPSDTWYDWVCLADGGNAASVGAYTEAKLAALEARVAALEGK